MSGNFSAINKCFSLQTLSWFVILVTNSCLNLSCCLMWWNYYTFVHNRYGMYSMFAFNYPVALLLKVIHKHLTGEIWAGLHYMYIMAKFHYDWAPSYNIIARLSILRILLLYHIILAVSLYPQGWRNFPTANLHTLQICYQALQHSLSDHELLVMLTCSIFAWKLNHLHVLCM